MKTVIIILFLQSVILILAAHLAWKWGEVTRKSGFEEGYRAGRLEMTAELVECDHVSDPSVLTAYETWSDIAASYKALDMAPYPCEGE